MEYLVIPGILTDSLADLKQKVEMVRERVKHVCVDVIDGVFAGNVTVGVEDLREVGWEGVWLDIQLMVEEPVDYLGQCQVVGAKRVFAHVEKMGKREKFISEAEDCRYEIGWGLDLYTPVSELSDKELRVVQSVLLMSVPAGFSGQQFNDQVLKKIERLRSRGFKGDIVVDGGINEETIRTCLQVGANQFSVTSAIWQSDDPIVEWNKLQKITEGQS